MELRDLSRGLGIMMELYWWGYEASIVRPACCRRALGALRCSTLRCGARIPSANVSGWLVRRCEIGNCGIPNHDGRLSLSASANSHPPPGGRGGRGRSRHGAKQSPLLIRKSAGWPDLPPSCGLSRKSAFRFGHCYYSYTQPLPFAFLSSSCSSFHLPRVIKIIQVLGLVFICMNGIVNELMSL